MAKGNISVEQPVGQELRFNPFITKDIKNHEVETLFCWLLAFAWQAGGIFMGALAEGAAHARCEAYTFFSKLVAKFVGCCESIFPTLLAIAIEQVDLRFGLRGERGGLHSEKTYLHSLLPIPAKERANLLKDFGVELRGRG